jgi:hypothetical protein
LVVDMDYNGSMIKIKWLDGDRVGALWYFMCTYLARSDALNLPTSQGPMHWISFPLSIDPGGRVEMQEWCATESCRSCYIHAPYFAAAIHR